MGRIFPRRLNRPSWPALIWVLVAVLTLAAGALLAASSDSGNTDVRTAAEQPASAEPLAEELAPVWSALAAVDDQRAVAGNTVITSSPRGLRGLDPVTGQERWHYLRFSATMCDFTVLDDVVVAIFRTTGRCNEAVALEPGTGVRRWYRNVEFSDRLEMLGSGTAALAATPDGIAVLDGIGDSIRWKYNPPQGCELSSIGIGNAGVVVLESCETGTTWLAEFNLYSGDQEWRVAPPSGELMVLGADGVVSLLVGQQLMILSARTGAVLSTMATDADDGRPAAALFAGQPGERGVPLVFVAGTLYAIEPSSGAVLWSIAATGAPASGNGGLIVPQANAFVRCNPLTGEELARSDATGAAIDDLTRIERTGSIVIAVTGDDLTAYG